jgi:uncharacterized protein YbjQ (UPF0145 family)
LDQNNDLHPDQLPEAPGWPIHPAMVSSSLDIPGFRIVRNFGIVQGLVVRAAGLTKSFTGSLQALSGGNVPEYQRLCETARRDAFMMMMQGAVVFRANGIIAFRYDTTEIGPALTEVLAYGTAVHAEDL